MAKQFHITPVRVGQSDDETPMQPVLAAAPGYTRRRKTDGLRRLIYFIDVPVYDLRHTQGDPLPEPEWRSLARHADLEIHLGHSAEIINGQASPKGGP